MNTQRAASSRRKTQFHALTTGGALLLAALRWRLPRLRCLRRRCPA